MAVAIWDHAPAAKELLAARLARGWRPTPTPTQKGNRILGYAACLDESEPRDALRACR